MKHELEHFQIGDSYGGNQDWFPTFMMRIGGCGAETACDSSLYFALHRGLTGLAPADAAQSKEAYIRFAYEMRPYLSPRPSGIDRLDIYMGGYAQYLQDHGETRLTMTPLDGSEPYEAARAAVIRQIDQGLPIPTLILNHRNPSLRDYVWHWFLINGYDEPESEQSEEKPGVNPDETLRKTPDDNRKAEPEAPFLVKAVTYSSYAWLNLRALWTTGHDKKGGFVLYHLDES